MPMIYRTAEQSGIVGVENALMLDIVTGANIVVPANVKRIKQILPAIASNMTVPGAAVAYLNMTGDGIWSSGDQQIALGAIGGPVATTPIQYRPVPIDVDIEVIPGKPITLTANLSVDLGVGAFVITLAFK